VYDVDGYTESYAYVYGVLCEGSGVCSGGDEEGEFVKRFVFLFDEKN
jgi:hypothetical protein